MHSVDGTTLRLKYDLHMLLKDQFMLSGVLEVVGDVKNLELPPDKAEWRVAAVRINSGRFLKQEPAGGKPRQGQPSPTGF
jgi:hypothetical protein